MSTDSYVYNFGDTVTFLITKPSNPPGHNCIVDVTFYIDVTLPDGSQNALGPVGFPDGAGTYAEVAGPAGPPAGTRLAQLWGQTGVGCINPPLSPVLYATTTYEVQGTTTTTTQSLPDLVVTSITLNPPSPIVGDAVYFAATVANQGGASAGPSVVQMTIDGVTLDSEPVPALSPGQSYTVSMQPAITFRSATTHNVCATADATNQVQESNENNNQLCKTISVVGVTVLDMQLADGISAKLTFDGLTVTLTLTLDQTRADQAKLNPLIIYNALQTLTDKQQKILDWASQLPQIGPVFEIAKLFLAAKNIGFTSAIWYDTWNQPRAPDGSLTITLPWDTIYKWSVGPSAGTGLPSGPSLITGIFSHANILVVAPDGRRLGTDPSSGQAVSEISGYYSGTGTEPQVAVVFSPINGQYSVQLTALDSGTAHIVGVTGSPGGASATSQVMELSLTSGATQTLSLEIGQGAIVGSWGGNQWSWVNFGLAAAATLVVVVLSFEIVMRRRKRNSSR